MLSVKPPFKFDIATIMREPGQYKLGSAIFHIVFGVTPKQKLQPVHELVTDKEVQSKAKRFVLASAATAAMAVFVTTLAKLKK